MRELWRRIYKAILEYRLERTLVHANKLQDKLRAISPPSTAQIRRDLETIRSRNMHTERIIKDLQKLNKELDAEDAEVIPPSKLWN